MIARTSIAFVVVAAGISLGFKGEDSRLLWSFEPSAELSGVYASHATVTQIGKSGPANGYALRLDFEAVERPQIEFSLTAAKSDWRPFGALAVDVSNPSEESVGFSVEVEDATGATTVARTNWDLGPHQSANYALAINSPWPAEMGMRGEPLIPGYHLMAGDHHPIDLARVAKFRIFLVKPAGARMLVIQNIRLIPGVTYDKIVDAFGQFALDDWPGKLKSATQFGIERRNEEAELKAHPSLPDRDEYGGWASGPQLDATGYFRTARHHGKWWLVTPNGHLFFSLGMNAVSVGESDTVVERREQMFRWLPAPGDPLAAHYGVSDHTAPIGVKIKFLQGRTFQFHTANLVRKYGRDWFEQWKSITLARLQAWGFNTIGNWSDPRVYDEDRMPYTATLEIRGAVAEIPSASDYWRRMADPFDPAFAEAVDHSVQAGTRCSNDPWCLGYFVDNELPWGTATDERGRYGLALGALSLGANSPAKQAIVDQVEQRYAGIDDFNKAWNLHLADWRQFLEQPFKFDGNFSNAMREDMGKFVRTLADRYFRTIRDALKKRDPNHLYLGSRFAGYTPESVEACAEFCDVISFNIYQAKVERAEWQFLDDLGKPVIIGEFHMGATDRGMFHPGLVSTPNQAARADGFMDYVRSVLDNPMFVGCHYFEYNDEPVTGRSIDGENYGIGFTDVVDGPYPEMVAAAKTVSADMYHRRNSSLH